MTRRFRDRFKLFGALGLSLFAIGVTAVSTFAWFQMNAQATPYVNSGSPSLSIGDISITKNVLQKDATGNVTYDGVSLATKGTNISTTQVENTQVDNGFDIPSQGLGYYAVKPDAHGHFPFLNNASNVKKFTQYDSNDVKQMQLYDQSYCTFAANDVFQIREYGYDTSNYKTINGQLTGVSSETTDLCEINGSGNIKVKVAGTYKIWLYVDGGTKIIRFDDMLDAATYNNYVAPEAPSDPSATTSTVSNSTYTMIKIVQGDGAQASWGYNTLWLDNFTFSSGYTIDDLAYFVSNQYGSEVTDGWNASTTTRSWHRYSNGFNLASGESVDGSSSTSHNFILPSWVTNCSVEVQSSYGNIGVHFDSNGGYDFQCTHGNTSMNTLTSLYENAGKKGDGTFAHNNESGTTLNGVGKTVTLTYAAYEHFPKWDGTNQYDWWQSIHFHTSIAANGSARTWNTASVITRYVSSSNGSALSYNLTGLAPTESLEIGVDGYSVVAAPTVPGMTFAGWICSRANAWGDSGNFNTSAGNKIQVKDGFTLYATYSQTSGKHTVAFFPSYFVEKTNGNLQQLTLNTEQEPIRAAVNISTAWSSVSQSFDDDEYVWRDNANGILYRFIRSGTSTTWYTNAACTTPVTGNVTANTIVYAKMVCPKLNTFYIESQVNAGGSSIQWGNCFAHVYTKSGESETWSTGDMDTDDAIQAMEWRVISGNHKIFRLSLPNLTGLNFNLFDGSTPTGGTEQTADITSVIDNGYLLLGGKYDSKRWSGWMSEKSTTLGSAKIQIYNSSSKTWSDIAGASMEYGDGIKNDFIYERGLTLAVGSVVRIHSSGSTSGGTTVSDGKVYAYGDYVTGNKSKHTYVAGVSAKVNPSDGSTTTNAGIKTQGYTDSHARFNFYLTHGGEVSIAMVPENGNGYYIMNKASNGNQTEGFIDAKKMIENTSGGHSIVIDAAASSVYYIRSYMNSVNELYKTAGTTPSGVSINGSTGEISFTAKDTYNVFLSKTGTISVSTYSSDTNFKKLNEINPLEAGSQDAIKLQNTSLVIGVKLNANNPENLALTLGISNALSTYTSVTCYLSSAEISASTMSTNPYDYMRMYHYDSELSANRNATSLSAGTIPAGNHTGASAYYLYILIDYVYYSGVNFSAMGNSPAGTIHFTLAAAQTSAASSSSSAS